MRRLLTRLAASTPTQSDLGLLLLRLWFGLVMATAHGWGKMTDLEKFTGVVARKGFFLPEVLAPLAALSEFAASLLLVIGLFTRPAATMVAATMLVAAFVIHADAPFGKKELALCYAVAALVLLVAGPGRFSLDRRLFGRGD